MPLVEVSVTEGALSQEQKVKMANDVCGLLMEAIPKLPKHAVSVIFYENPPQNWLVGGVTVEELKQRQE